MSVKYDRYLDDDWRFRLSYDYSFLFGLSLKQDFSVESFRDIGVNFIQDTKWEGESFYHSDYSYSLSETMGYAFNKYLGTQLSFGLTRFDYMGPSYLRDNIKDSSFLEMIDDYKLFSRGYYYPMRLSVGGNDKENTFASSFGNEWDFGLSRVFSPDLGDYYSIDFKSINYFLLGNRAYRISRKEEKSRIKKISKFNFSEVIPFLDIKDLDKALFERRIIVQYVRFRQAFKAEDQPIMYQGYSEVGRGTPLRAYPSRSFINKGFASWGLEYRWPIIRQVDGVFFNEYAQVFSEFQNIQEGRLYNSWGFGFRVRNPELYFLRMQLAFHGLQGPGIIMTTGSAF